MGWRKEYSLSSVNVRRQQCTDQACAGGRRLSTLISAPPAPPWLRKRS